MSMDVTWGHLCQLYSGYLMLETHNHLLEVSEAWASPVGSS